MRIPRKAVTVIRRVDKPGYSPLPLPPEYGGAFSFADFRSNGRLNRRRTANRLRIAQIAERALDVFQSCFLVRVAYADFYYIRSVT
ncbi:MAG: hypothetical protein LBC65_02020 [Oscillospiraceae bacterium]|nr:hypothetical protein [Oscillospiraceae bacterium]